MRRGKQRSINRQAENPGGQMTDMPNRKPPLSGIRVIELARVLAGPWAGQMLADMGADVIKVENPEGGDDTRAWGPPFVESADGENLSAAYYHATNRGKRSIVADLKTPEGCALVRRLVRTADVVIENFKRDGLAKYGLDYESLRVLNPKLIYCSITGFGQTGPYADFAGYDYIVQGMSGFMSITGEPDGQPMKAGVAVADIFTGIYSVSAIQAALIHAMRSGEGQHIDMALLDVQSAVLANQNMNYLISGRPPIRPRGVAAIERGLMSKLRLGNLDAKRDWGHARDYVEGMWRIVQQEIPEDYVLATGEAHTVREFVELAFGVVGKTIEWHGDGSDEVGYDAKTGNSIIEIDPRYFRPAEVDFLLGDPSKARRKLDWSHSTSFCDLVQEMVEADLRLVMLEEGRNEFVA